MTKAISLLLDELKSLGVELVLKQNQLSVQGPAHVLNQELRETLARRKPEILAHLAQTVQNQESARYELFELTADQQRLWFIEKLTANPDSFVLRAAFELVGDIDLPLWQKAVHAVLTRHPVLGCRLEEIDQKPRLLLPEKTTLPIEVLRHDQHPMDAASLTLEHQHLFRVVMIQRDAQRYELVVLLHHLISDRSSMAIVINDLFRAVREPHVPPRMMAQSLDWLRAQHQLQTDSRGAQDKALAYWRQALNEAPSEVSLPFDRSRPSERCLKPAAIRLCLPASADLGKVSQSRGLTPFMAYLTVFAFLLRRWSGQQDCVIGCPVSRRDTSALQDTVGFLVQTLALRLDASACPDLDSLSREVRKSFLTAIDQPPLALDKIVQALGLERHLNRNPLYQVMFVLQNEALKTPELPGIRIRPLPVPPLPPEVDLNLSIEYAGTDDSSGLSRYEAYLEYDESLFNKETVEQLLTQYTVLCQQWAASGHNSLSVQNLTYAQWTGSVNPLPETSVYTLLRGQLEQLPVDHLVLEDPQRTYTRHALLNHVDELAAALKARGVNAKDTIGVCLTELGNLTSTMLALWKLGATIAFLPVDGHAEDLAAKAKSVQVKAIIVGDTKFALIPGIEFWLFADLKMANAIAAHDCASAHPEIAYICFTSGSTGLPKAIPISHRSLVNHILDTTVRFELTRHDRVLQFAAPSFDVMLEEILPSLNAGARVVQLSAEERADFQSFEASIANHQISVMNLPAAYWHAWVQESLQGRAVDLAHLRLLITGSEQISMNTVQTWLRIAPRVRLLGAYGLTETTISVLFKSCDQTLDARTTGSLPLGQPISNVAVSLRDEQGQVVPVLCVGEIVVEGAALLHGSDGTLHTGDLGRMDLNGDLWCLGRLDRQVKIRGMRVQPAMVEAQLTSIPGVSEAAVLVSRDRQKNSLIAFVNTSLAEKQLRLLMRSTLPAAMLPERLHIVASLPKTAHGKINYPALQDLPPVMHAQSADSAISPGTKEALIAEIFRDVLGIKRVQAEDNFFELGGDSITSLQIIARARKFQLSITPKAIYEHQTVAAIAEQSTFILAQPQRKRHVGTVPATPILAWFSETLNDHWKHFNQAVMLVLPTSADLDALQTALNTVLQTHEIFGLIATPRQTAQGPGLDYVIAEQPQSIEVQVLTRLTEESDTQWQQRYTQQKALLQASLDPSIGRNVAALAIPGQQRLLLTIHHLCIDVISWSVVLEDLRLTYEAIISGHPTARAPQGESFLTWSARVVELANTPAVAACLPIFETHLSGASEPLLPEAQGDPGLDANARSHEHELDETLTRALLQVCPGALGLRLDELMLVALLLVQQQRGASALRIDLERNGRISPFDDLDLVSTVGWFTSVVPLRLTCGKTQSIQALIAQVRQQVSESPFEGLGYGMLRYGRNAPLAERLAKLPDADVLLNYVGVLNGWESGPFQPVNEDTGPTIALGTRRSHMLEINAGVVSDRLLIAINAPDSTEVTLAVKELCAALTNQLKRLVELAHEVVDTREAPSQTETAQSVSSKHLAQAVQSVGLSLPVTPLQHAMLLRSLYEPSTYFDQLRFLITGPLNTIALKTAWQELVKRHEALRCSFDFDENSMPFQRIAADAELSWETLDWRALPKDAHERMLQDLMQIDRATGFDLQTPVLMRMHLIRLDENCHQLLWSCHHLIIDGWSVSVLMEEWGQLYRALCLQQPAQLDSAPSWSDYVSEHCKQDNRRALEFWKKTLSQAQATHIAQQVAHSPESKQACLEKHLSLNIEPALMQQLNSVSQLAGAPLGVIAQACWALVLRRYKLSDHVLFGMTVANRLSQNSNNDRLVGMTINTVPVHVQVNPNETVVEFLSRLRNEALERQSWSFPGLGDILQTGSFGDLAPFDTLLLVQNYPRSALELQDGLRISVVEVAEQTGFALTMILEGGDQPHLTAVYDAARISDSFASQVLEHWKRMLHALSGNPSGFVKTLSLYDAKTLKERLQLAEGPAASLDRPTLNNVVQHWAQFLPNHLAVIGPEGSLTYQGLIEQVDRFNALLEQSTVSRGDCVAIHLPNSTRAIIALLAILKRGATAVCIDTSYPPERINQMLQASDARAVVTESRQLQRLEQSVVYPACTLLLESIDLQHVEIAPVVMTRHDDSAEAAAYLVFTSGSTGQPKAVSVPVRGMCNLIAAQRYHFDLRRHDRVLQFSSLSFDASIWEICLALGAGATLCIPKPETERTGEELLEFLTRVHVTTATLPPSLLASMPERVLPALHTLIVAGEACPVSLPAFWAKGRRFFNAYGPSETTVCATLQLVDQRCESDIPIGSPLLGTKAYVVDSDGQLVPPGGTGELWVGGDGVASGYLNQPELTQRAFVTDPWSNDPLARLYRTGDRVRLDEQGSLTFEQRLDRQFKLRGFRIEPGEIEAQLSRGENVSQALVGIVRLKQDAEPSLVAWLLPVAGTKIDLEHIRQTLKKCLPAHMVPNHFVCIDSIALTTNGKVDWQKLPTPLQQETQTAPVATLPLIQTDQVTEVARTVETIWSQLIGVTTIEHDQNFFDLGGQSLLLVRSQRLLDHALGIRIPTRVLFEKLTIRSLTTWLLEQHPVTASTPSPQPATTLKDDDDRDAMTAPEDGPQATKPLSSLDETLSTEVVDIAVIGMACRFPSAPSLEAFWELLRNGQEGITTLSRQQLLDAGLDPAMIDMPAYVKRRGLIEQADCFDADFFKMAKSDAQSLDPQHRQLLECAWHAFEDADELPAGHVGVFAGCAHNTWLDKVLKPAGQGLAGSDAFQAIIGNDKDFLATQIAYRLNLTGPALTVQSACSTSLLAVSMAVDALRAGRCDMALAGGVALTFPENSGYLYEPSMILSPDGHCRPFSCDASGTVPSAGVGAILLKPLKAAQADGNRIYAVIRGCGVTNDGAAKMNFAAPGVDGQADAMRQALQDARLNPEDIDFLEAHGTGTPLGDPVELAAIARVYRERQQPLLLGSVKSNIGHADSAAGIAGFIKAALSLHHGAVPKTLHADTLNPRFGSDTDWFEATRQLTPLKKKAEPSRAGISSFGIGGTNVHVIVEQYRAPSRSNASESQNEWQLLPLSAQRPEAINIVAHHLANSLTRRDCTLAELAFSLQTGRTAKRFRSAILARDQEQAIALLEKDTDHTDASEAIPRLGVLLTGQGSQHFLMGQSLFQRQPGFAEVLFDIDTRLRPLLGHSLIELFSKTHVDIAIIEDTRIAQPAIFALSVACARFWESFGLKLDLMLGHSLGEYTAAHLAGVMDLDHALDIICERARLMANMPTGRMLAVNASPNTLPEDWFKDDLISIAALNGPEQLVLSGDEAHISRLSHALDRQNVPNRLLRTSHAFHSQMMRPAAESLRSYLATRDLRKPSRRLVSNVSGTWMTAKQATSPDYWASHMLAPVKFAEGVHTLLSKGCSIGLEIGPGQVLTSLARNNGLASLASLEPALSGLQPSPHTEGMPPVYLQTIAQMWKQGFELKWSGLETPSSRQARHASLPVYPFSRQRQRPHVTVPKRPLENWFLSPSWTTAQVPPPLQQQQQQHYVIAGDSPELAHRLGDALGAKNHHVTISTDMSRSISQAQQRDAHDLSTRLVLISSGQSCQTGQESTQWLIACLRTIREFIRDSRPRRIAIDVLTIEGVAYDAQAHVRPVNGALLAAIEVLMHEYPETAFACLDIAKSTSAHDLTAVLDWFASEQRSAVHVLRDGTFLERQVLPVALGNDQDWPLENNAVVLITGGTGAVGSALALDIAQRVQGVTLILANSTGQASSALLEQFHSTGSKVEVIALPLQDEQATRHALQSLQERLGMLHGVIHAAGVADYGGVLDRRDAQSLHDVLAPKIHGLHAIETALSGQPLKFMVLCSTLGSFLPAAKFGQSAYSAANAYLDASAAAIAQRQPWRVLTVNWDDWTHAGMTVRSRAQAKLAPMEDHEGITAMEGARALRHMLASPYLQLATSVHDFVRLQERFAEIKTAQEPTITSAASSVSLSDRLLLIFRSALGDSECTSRDSFFDRGGHSLLALKLVRSIRDTLGVELSLSDLFDSPSVDTLAQRISLPSSSNQQDR